MRHLLSPRQFVVVLSLILSAAFCGANDRVWAGDEVAVRFDAKVREQPATGRLILLMAKAGSGANPLDAPFWNDPQPICSIAVTGVKPGEAMRIGDAEATFPGPMSTFDGEYTVRAVLDVDNTTGSFNNCEANLVSEPVQVKWRSGEDDHFEIALTGHIEVPQTADTDQVKEVAVRSERLSAFFGRDVMLRAGVVLPSNYAEHPERQYAAIYHSPGFGGRHFDAWHRNGNRGGLGDRVINIFLDPDGPNNHHLFVNSANNGPVGDALVYELIPELEKRFRLVAKPEARLLTGHSSGGFTSVWLQVNYPETFGGCWATGPDPVDFRAFQLVNIYDDDNAYVDAEGHDRPSVVMGGRTVCTIRQENGMEYALDPTGGAGQQWSSWMACFSKKGADGRPVSIWNLKTGKIDPMLRDYWKKSDVRLILESRWKDIGPLMCERLRIICGDHDNFSLNEAVQLLRDSLDKLPGWRSEWATPEERASHGYITLVPGGTHMNLGMYGVSRQIAGEMEIYLRQHGLIE